MSGWFSYISEIIAPLPQDEIEQKTVKDTIEDVDYTRRASTSGVGAKVLVRRALDFEENHAVKVHTPKVFQHGGEGDFSKSPQFQASPVHHRVAALVGHAVEKPPTAAANTPRPKSSLSIENFDSPTRTPTSRPSSRGMFSPSTPLSPFVNAAEVPEAVVQQAGEAAVMTAMYATDVDELLSHHNSSFMWCGASAKRRGEYFGLLDQALQMHPELIHARQTNLTNNGMYGWTGLHMVAFKDNIEMCKLLLRKGANSLAVGVDGKTPLHVAARFLRPEICQLLHDHMKEANVNGNAPVGEHAPVDLKGFTPSVYAGKLFKKPKGDGQETIVRKQAEICALLYCHGDRHISPRHRNPHKAVAKSGLNYESTTVPHGGAGASSVTLKYGHQWMKGWRENFEDAYIAQTAFDHVKGLSMFAIFDGHLGSFTARWIANNFVERLQHIILLEKATSGIESDLELCADLDRMANMLEKAFLSLDRDLRKNPMLSGEIASKKAGWPGVQAGEGKFDPRKSGFSGTGVGQAKAPDQSGCTGVIVLITASHFITANVGDSRSIVCSKTGVIVDALSNDHNPDAMENECRRIARAGGVTGKNRVWLNEANLKRGKPSIAVTRAFGDYLYKDKRDPLTGVLCGQLEQILIPLPDISFRARRKEDRMLFLACDGVWDVMKNREASDFMLEAFKKRYGDGLGGPEVDLDDCIYDLLIKCVDKNSKDNISAIAVLFDDATQQHLPEEFGKVVAEQRVRFYITDRMAPEKAPSPINLAADSSRTPMVNATSGASAELAARLDRIRGKSLAAISEDRGVPAAMNLSLESINLDDSA